jgi:hypothetical protein
LPPANAAASNSIVLNAAGVDLTSPTNGLFVSPIRGSGLTTQRLFYNPVTREITYDTSARRLEGENYDQVIPLSLQEANELKAARETDAIRIEALEAAREMDAIRIEALGKKVDTLILELQQLVAGSAN